MAKLKEQTETVVINDDVLDKVKKTISQIGDGQVGNTICHMIQSRFRVLYVQSAEEKRIVDFFKQVALDRNADVYRWDCDRGLLNAIDLKQVTVSGSEVHSMPSAALSYVIDEAKKDTEKLSNGSKAQEKIFLLLDFHIFLDEPNVQRKIKEFSDILSTCTIIVVSPIFNCPATLEKYVTLIDFPVPSKDELKQVLHRLMSNPVLQQKLPGLVVQAQKEEEELIQSVSGLSLVEAENAFSMSIIKEKKFNISIILDEKKQTIRKSGALEYMTPKCGMEHVGGLGDLKKWFETRKLAFKEDAREFGLPVPKGVLLGGSPGTGKSLICEAVASMYEMPLLRLDFGAIFSSLVGDSEKNIRSALKIAEAVSPAIMMWDEIEKGISGVSSSGETDGGVTSRVFGTLLTWMQMKTHPVFIVATANNVLGIPPEFMRAGRFDEIFFVDLPDEIERMDIAGVLLKKKGRDPKEFDLEKIAAKCEHYSAAEIEKGIDNALFVAFYENKRKMTTKDIVSQMGMFHPLYDTRHEEIEAIRKWALGENGSGGRARLANSSKKQKINQSTGQSNRMLDIDLSMKNLEI